jgi:hypothetical protein
MNERKLDKVEMNGFHIEMLGEKFLFFALFSLYVSLPGMVVVAFVEQKKKISFSRKKNYTNILQLATLFFLRQFFDFVTTCCGCVC